MPVDTYRRPLGHPPISASDHATAFTCRLQPHHQVVLVTPQRLANPTTTGPAILKLDVDRRYPEEVLRTRLKAVTPGKKVLARTSRRGATTPNSSRGSGCSIPRSRFSAASRSRSDPVIHAILLGEVPIAAGGNVSLIRASDDLIHGEGRGQIASPDVSENLVVIGVGSGARFGEVGTAPRPRGLSRTSHPARLR